MILCMLSTSCTQHHGRDQYLDGILGGVVLFQHLLQLLDLLIHVLQHTFQVLQFLIGCLWISFTSSCTQVQRKSADCIYAQMDGSVTNTQGAHADYRLQCQCS